MISQWLIWTNSTLLSCQSIHTGRLQWFTEVKNWMPPVYWWTFKHRDKRTGLVFRLLGVINAILLGEIGATTPPSKICYAQPQIRRRIIGKSFPEMFKVCRACNAYIWSTQRIRIQSSCFINTSAECKSRKNLHSLIVTRAYTHPCSFCACFVFVWWVWQPPSMYDQLPSPKQF
jgi:hypothetical protein